MEIVRVPLLNANEDEVEVVDVVVQDGDEVQAGELICVVESTKATFDVEAPAAGFVRKINVKQGQRITVGSLLAVVTPTKDEAFEMPDDGHSAASDTEARVTRKAAELAAKHDLDLSTLDVALIKERDVRRLLEERGTTKTDTTDGERAATKTGELPPEIAANTNSVVILGAGGHARVLIDLIREGRRDLTIIGLVDDSPSPPKEVLGIPVLGDSSVLGDLRERGVTRAVLGVGAVTNNSLRIELFNKLKNHGFSVPNLIHPRANVEPSVIMGEGNQIFAGAVVGSAVELGDNTIINSNVVTSHDCRIGSHTHLTPGAILAGGVTVGENTVVGMGVTIYLGLVIGRDVTIANGIHLMRDIEDGALVRSIQQ